MIEGAVSEISRARVIPLYPGIRPFAYRVLQDVFFTTGRKMNVTEGLRSMDAQLALYAKGRELQGTKWIVVKPGEIVTNAKPGLSWHCYGLAFDCAWAGDDPYLQKETSENRNELWIAYGKVVVHNSLKWGGGFHLINGVNDKPHAEMTYGLTIEQALELYETGGLKGVWAFLDGIRGIS